MAATNEQVQQFVDNHVRPFSELARALYLRASNDAAIIEDVYQNVIEAESTWVDDRTDGPPHLVTKQDVLSYNSFVVMLKAFVEGTLTDGNKNEGGAQWPVILRACVQPVRVN